MAKQNASNIEQQLQEQSREELVALIADLRKRQPDLDEWIEPWLATHRPATAGAAVTVTADLTRIRRQAARAFPFDDWGAHGSAAGALTELLEIGAGYAAAGQWANAQVVYSTVAEEALEHYEEVDDEGWELGAAIQDCARGLRDCLEAQATLPLSDRLPAPARAALFDSLYAIWRHELNYGSGDEAVDLPDLLARTANDEERERITEDLRAELGSSSGADTSGSWGRRERVNLLLALQGPAGRSDERALAEYRRVGLFQDVAALLLALGLVDEAIKVAREQLASYQHVTQFATALLERGPEWRGQVLALVEARLQAEEANAAGAPPSSGSGARDASSVQREQQIAHYRAWLEERYIEFGLSGPALAIALRRFEAGSNSRTYESVKKAANLPDQPANCWAGLRPGLIATLETRSGWSELVVIYLGEGAVGAALAALNTLQTRPVQPDWSVRWGVSWLGGQHGDFDLQLRVAQAAEQDYPQEAIRIYQRVAERIIEKRDRQNYSHAAEHLARVKALYTREGQSSAWQNYIADLRAHNKMLRALTPELDARGLR
jgi:hypothetical protein